MLHRCITPLLGKNVFMCIAFMIITLIQTHWKGFSNSWTGWHDIVY